MSRNLHSLVRTTLVTTTALGLVSLLVVAGYALMNGSGHTGVNPYFALVIFGPVAALGLLSTAFGAASVRRTAIAATATGLLGIALLVFLDVSNTLLPYEEWIRRGMP